MGYDQVVFPKDSTFLVTGGAGFIGSNLVEALLHLGYQVRALDNLSTGHFANLAPFVQNDRFEFVKGDIRDLGTCMKAADSVHYVLHQAAWGSVPRSIAMPLLYEEINIRGTMNMLEAASKNHAKKFVYASSSSVYGDSTAPVKKEGYEGNCLSPYAVTKKTDEYFANLYSNLFDLDTCGLRYFNVFGRRQDPDGAYAAVIPKFITHLLNDERPTINGDGKQSRDFTYIENVIEANLKAAASDSKTAGQAFNVAYGERTVLIDVYDTIAQALGKNIQPNFAPPRAGDIKHSLADISKAKSMLGYDPSWSFSRGILASIHWYGERMVAPNKHEKAPETIVKVPIANIC